MAGIATKYVTENGLNNEISIEELTQYAPGINILLTDKVKRDQAQRRLQKGSHMRLGLGYEGNFIICRYLHNMGPLQ